MLYALQSLYYLFSFTDPPHHNLKYKRERNLSGGSVKKDKEIASRPANLFFISLTMSRTTER